MPKKRGRDPSGRSAALLEYVRAVADSIGLRDWEIAIDLDSTPAPDHEAEIGTTDGQRAVVSVAADFWTSTQEKQRRTIVHELCHLPLDRIRTSGGIAQQAMSPDAYRLFEATIQAAEEHAVEHFARVLSPLLPMPPRFPNG